MHFFHLIQQIRESGQRVFDYQYDDFLKYSSNRKVESTTEFPIQAVDFRHFSIKQISQNSRYILIKVYLPSRNERLRKFARLVLLPAPATCYTREDSQVVSHQDTEISPEKLIIKKIRGKKCEKYLSRNMKANFLN